jgi:hypothetical protein
MNEQGLLAVVDMLRGMVFQAIERTPRQFRKDLENVEAFLNAAEVKGRALIADNTTRLGQIEEYLSGLAVIGTHFVDGLISMNPSKMSLAWLFKGFDPFKPMRLEADKFAVRWQLNWSRK